MRVVNPRAIIGVTLYPVPITGLAGAESFPTVDGLTVARALDLYATSLATYRANVAHLDKLLAEREFRRQNRSLNQNTSDYIGGVLSPADADFVPLTAIDHDIAVYSEVVENLVEALRERVDYLFDAIDASLPQWLDATVLDITAARSGLETAVSAAAASTGPTRSDRLGDALRTARQVDTLTARLADLTAYSNTELGSRLREKVRSLGVPLVKPFPSSFVGPAEKAVRDLGL